MNRRDALRWMGMSALTGAALHLPSQGESQVSFGAPRSVASPSFEPDVELALTAAPGEARILPGTPTRVWRFTGTVLKGARETLQVVPDSYLGPVIRLRRGQHVRIRFTNQLPEPTIIHWHGLDVPSAMDGHPQSVIDPGKEYVYEFEVTNRAGTYWYHPHPDERTGPQVVRGLAGLLVVSDDEESAAALPSGPEELLCVFQDRQFDGENQLVYVAGGMMMNQMGGFLGDRVLVNGRERPTLSLATRAYRLRVLNGSNARVYKLAWDDATPMTVIGSDGGLLEHPVRQAYLTLAPGQRADLILDLGARAVDTTLRLLSAPYPAGDVGIGGMGMGMGMGMRMEPDALPNGAPLTLLTIHVSRKVQSTFRLPERLSRFDASWERKADAPARRINLSFQRGQWTLSGRTFEMTATTPEETVSAGTTQVWELVNTAGMMGMQMAHPIHLHGRQFRVLGRELAAGAPSQARSIREGLVDQGWMDTVLVLPGEIVRLQVRFTDHPGLYLYHCHILEHEDMGMMRNFRVTGG